MAGFSSSANPQADETKSPVLTEAGTGSGKEETGVGSENEIEFRFELIDGNGPQNIDTVGVSDINRDGLVDVLIAGAVHTTTDFVWYESPSWTKHIIDTNTKYAVDVQGGDIDLDGDTDVLVSSWYGNPRVLLWYENLDGLGTQWSSYKQIPESTRMHDLFLRDFDKDGDLDIIARSQTLFDEDKGHEIVIHRQESPTNWTKKVLITNAGEGLAIGDIDGDSYLDVAASGKWHKNPGSNMLGTWRAYNFFPSTWAWYHLQIQIGDINRDGDPDIVLVPAEPHGDEYKISWFEAPPDPTSRPWTEHVIEPDVRSIYHSLQLADVDSDGDLDFFTAEMSYVRDAEVMVYENLNDGAAFVRHLLPSNGPRRGSHNMRTFDFDNDGDDDVVGANWGDDNVDLWVNHSCAGAGWHSYGQGWPGTDGIPSFVSRNDPIIGQGMTVDIANSSGADTTGFLFIGLMSADIQTRLGGRLLLRPRASLTIGIPAGGLSLPVTIPDDFALCGLPVFLQVLENDPGASHGVSFTPGLQLNLGVDGCASAGWRSYGQGWPGTFGVPSFVSRDDPVIGQSATFDIENSLGADTTGFLFIGVTRLDIQTRLGGRLLLGPGASLTLAVPAGGLTLPASIPDDPALCGLSVFLQVLENDPGASHGVSFTPGLELDLGS